MPLKRITQEPQPLPYKEQEEAEASPNYVETLIQLADDAGWLAREITLPDHPPPQASSCLLYDGLKTGQTASHSQRRQSDTRGLCL